MKTVSEIFLGNLILFIIRKSYNFEELKNYIEKGILKGLNKLFSHNIYCYNSLKIKNISMKNITLLFLIKSFLYKILKFINFK